MKSVIILLISLIISGLTAADTIAQGLGFKGVGGRGGIVFADNGVSDPFVGGHFHLGEIAKNLVLMPSIDYRINSGNVDLFSINGNARYYAPLGGSLDFFVGGGPAFNIARVSLGGKNKTNTSFSLNALAGFELPLSKRLTGFGMIMLNTEDAQFKIGGGGTIMFGKTQ